MTTNQFSAQSLLRPEIADLEAYVPIQPFEVLSQRLGIPADQIIKLDANENPYGPLPAVSKALAAYPYYHIYPDPQQAELCAALSRFVGVPAANILASHGADELLDYLCRLFLQPGDAMINCPPTFGMYSIDAGLAGAQVIDAWRNPDYSLNVDEIIRIAQTSKQAKILFLTSPNNPSGNWLPDAELRRLLALPLLVVLDEAYVEFADHASRANWVLDYENLVILRTFSKSAGIAGLRLGYGICPDWLMAALWKFKQPYNVNVAATVAGLASLHHVEEILAVVAQIKAERNRLFAALETISYLHPYPTQANFILCRVLEHDAREVKGLLEQQGILVRYYNKPGLDNCIRISVGRPAQTDRLLAVFRAL